MTREDKLDRVLVVDDDEIVLELLQLTLSTEGFEVHTAPDGRLGFNLACELHPDVVLSDIMMPEVDGIALTRALRERPDTRDTCVILLTAKTAVEDKVRGLEAGADDYITKPFELAELTGRMRAALRRVRSMLSLNPLTGLPGNTEIDANVSKLIGAGAPFALMQVDLDNFKAYNDRYGVMAGDTAIKVLADCLRKAVGSGPDPEAFLGHVGGDDMVVGLYPDAAIEVATKIIELWDERAPSLYLPEDARRGYIVAEDRDARPTRFPIMSLSIGIASSTARPLTNPQHVSEVATAMKYLAKRNPRSTYVLDGSPAEEGVTPSSGGSPEPTWRDISRAVRSRAEEVRGASREPIRVLIVDDDADIRKMLRLYCDVRDIEVIGEAADGPQAISVARALAPQVVILDLRLPGMDGDEVAARLRREFPDVRILGFSAWVESGTDWADAFVSKRDLYRLPDVVHGLMSG